MGVILANTSKHMKGHLEQPYGPTTTALCMQHPVLQQIISKKSPQDRCSPCAKCYLDGMQTGTDRHMQKATKTSHRMHYLIGWYMLTHSDNTEI